MEFKAFVFNPIQENTYVIYDETGEAAIIDAGNFDETENDKLASFISENKLSVKCVFNTHNHWDHIFGLEWVRKTYNPRIYCHADDLPWMDNFSTICESYGFGKRNVPQPTNYYYNGQAVTVGNMTLKVLHTPGHSAGGVSLYCDESKLLFSGDTLFFNCVGRADLPGGDDGQLIRSIKTQILTLPDDTIVLPGHGLRTDIKYERLNNPYLQ